MIVLVPRVFSYVVVMNEAFKQDGLDLVSLDETEKNIKNALDANLKAIEESVRKLQGASSAAIDNRLVWIAQEIRTIDIAVNRSFLKVRLGLPGVDVDVLKAKILGQLRKPILEQERSFLEALLAYKANQENHKVTLQNAKDDLEQRRQVHLAAYQALQQNNQSQNILINNDGFRTYLIPFTPSYNALQWLKSQNLVLYQRNSAAAQEYNQQRQVVALIAAPRKLKSFKLNRPDVESALAPLKAERDRLKQALRDNWLGRWFAAARDDMWKALPWAISIVAGIVFMPIAIKAVFYFVLAPIATRSSAVALLPQSRGEMNTVESAGVAREAPGSSTSREVLIDASHELLVHPEYLQSSPHISTNETKWLLSRRYWLASIAAGLYAVTRMRSDTATTVVLSATRDPLSEVGTLEIPVGSAFALQPRNLIGVLQRRDQPLRISSHWRAWSLHAWLTLQLRYLVFHGPVTLIVKGCRGVRIERAEKGRSVNQAATIGFSANLAYSSRRSETFVGYLSGKLPLLNDSFSGASGYYVYQEMPHGEGRQGVIGRGLEGVTDALMKIVGI